jgi:chromosome partitioning protein
MENQNFYNITPPELKDCLGGITTQGVHKALKTHNIHLHTINTKRKIVPPLGVRKLFEERGFSYPNKNISFQIVKGGVGKTSLSFSLAVRAVHYGARVLAIDFDQQANLTRSLSVDARNVPVWLNIYRDKVSSADAIIKLSDTFHIIPSSLNNSRLDTELTSSSANLKDLVTDALEPIRKNYDLVIMDCPPALNKINTAVTCASDEIIIPVNPDPYAMDGLNFTLAELSKVKKEFKLDYDYKIVWNRYDARERLGVYYMHELAKNEEWASHIYPVVIRTDTTFKNSIFDAKTIFDSPKSPVREDVDQFTKEVLGINSWKESRKEVRA